MDRKVFFWLIVFGGLSSPVYGQAGALDISFDADGKLTTAMNGTNDVIRAVAVQGDGKIVVAGFAGTGSNVDFALARYNTDGSLDTGFSGDGKLILVLDTSESKAFAIAIQPDGKIIAAGTAGVGVNCDYMLVRLNSDGSFDTSFDGDGMVRTVIGTASDYLTGMVLQPDGKIVVAGYSFASFYFKFSAARYNADGSLDNSFSGDGKLITSIGGYFDIAYAVTLQSDNKILVTGSSNNGSDEDFVVVRYNVNGTLDNTFDGDGIVTTPIGSSYEVPYAIVVQPDGKMIAAGCTFNGTDDDFALVRYQTNGIIDSSYGVNGIAITSLGADDWIFGMVLQPDGKGLVGGYTQNGVVSDFAMVRYNIDGSTDGSFDSDGIVTTDFVADDDMAYAIALQPDLKIVAAGYSTVSADRDFAVVRYISGLNVGLVEFSDLTSLFVYPNPILQQTTLQFSLYDKEEITIELMNTDGKILANYADHELLEAGEHNQLISLPEDLRFGNYFIVISSPSGKVSIKIVK